MNGYTGSSQAPCYGCGGTGMPSYSDAPTGTGTYQSALPSGIPAGPTYSGPIASLQQSMQTGGQPPMPTGGQMMTTNPTQQLPRPSGMTPQDLTPITALNQPLPLTTQNIQYINTFLKTQIGRKVTVDFLIGTGTLVDRTGTLMGVGANYILLNEVETDDLLVCDFYSIKFVRVYY